MKTLMGSSAFSGRIALDLLLFLGLQLNIFLVGLNDADRLDEQRGAGGGNVVDQALHYRHNLLALHYRHNLPTLHDRHNVLALQGRHNLG